MSSIFDDLEKELFHKPESEPASEKVETIEIDIEDKPKKTKKPKKEMSEERKAQLKEQLRRGRETALKNRQKKALGKKIDREEKEKELDEKIARKVLNKNSFGEDDIEKLKTELQTIKEKGTNNNSDELEKMKKNMFLMSKTVDHLLEENRNYKKRKEEKKKQKEELKSNPINPTPAPAGNVFNSGKYRKGLNLKGML